MYTKEKLRFVLPWLKLFQLETKEGGNGFYAKKESNRKSNFSVNIFSIDDNRFLSAIAMRRIKLNSRLSVHKT